jgi:hypothetical protein
VSTDLRWVNRPGVDEGLESLLIVLTCVVAQPENVESIAVVRVQRKYLFRRITILYYLGVL